jgi:hypothetical protein
LVSFGLWDQGKNQEIVCELFFVVNQVFSYVTGSTLLLCMAAVCFALGFANYSCNIYIYMYVHIAVCGCSCFKVRIACFHKKLTFVTSLDVFRSASTTTENNPLRNKN